MLFRKIKLILFIKSIFFSALIAQTGTISSPFISLSQAASINSAGIYYFNVGSKSFSTQVSDYGWVLIATDLGGSSASSLPQTTVLTPTTRGVLSAAILNSLVPITAVGISSSDNAINVTTTNTLITTRINAFSPVNQGSVDNSLFGTPWVGIGASNLNSQSAYCNDITTLDAVVYHPCGDGNKFHWLPNTGQLAEIWNNGFISSSTQFNLWIQSSATLSPLPIELLNFNASYNKYTHAVDLSWETATENNNDYFTIEKSSDGNIFKEIKSIKSKENSGNSTSVLKYKTTDQNPLFGISYYRLKQTDFNGHFKYFKIVEVNTDFTKEQETMFYPNPASINSQLYINLSGYQKQNVTLTLKDMEGREFISKNFMLQEDSDPVYVCKEINILSPGIYIMEILANSKKTIRNKIILN